MNLEALKNLEYFNNTLEEYTIALVVFIGVWVAFKILRVVILARLAKWAKKTKFAIDDEAVNIIDRIPNGLFTIIALYVAIKPLEVYGAINRTLEIILIVGLTYAAVKAAQDLVSFLISHSAKKKDLSSNAYHGVQIIINAIIWATAILIVLDNLGVDITALVASLGIGGIAVALAVQNILADMFSSFSIYFDKPFEVGDYIVVEPHRGTVQKIGLKTTRIKSIDGEEIVISNREITETRVQNFKRLKKRRALFTIGIVYETPLTKVKKVNKIVKEIFKKIKGIDLDRTNFKELADFSLNFEIVYFIDSNEYKDYMNAQEKINLALMDAFAKEGIEFAYPTQQVLVSQNS